jgi:exopolyphosphatase/guanosine-5'-triphosphate,3'-diphosphate pyrophosphatase
MAPSAIVAAVDIGTNSVKLTVARTEPGGGLRVLADTTQTTRLGKNVDAAGRLDSDAVERTLEALAGFARLARGEHGASRIAAVGTSALRDAANGPEFVARAKAILNGTVEIVSGDREARLIHTAAVRDPDLALPRDAPIAVMDIGGGSTEFVLGTGEAITFRDSLQLGAVRLTERALPTDPPRPEELAEAARAADAVLAAVPVPPVPVTVVGSGGTIANVAAMEGVTAIHGARLTLARIEARVAFLAAQTIAERRGIPGLEPARADVILAGALIQARALRRLNASEVTVSVRSLRYGLLYELADAKTI